MNRKLVGIIQLSVVVPAIMCMCMNAVAQDGDEKDKDPWIGMNRITHQFNDTADRLILKPAAKGYQAITPQPVRRSVSNFFGNIDDVNNGINNLLQGKIGAGLGDFARLLINSSIGVAGLFDPASGFGLEKHDESFGQTLSVWGLPSGPYLVVPFLGPRTVTDALVNTGLDGVRYLNPVDHRNSVFGFRAIDQREGLLSAEKVVFGDKYIFYRDAYLQRRAYLVADGEIEDEFDDF